jgi:hypothetical protein
MSRLDLRFEKGKERIEDTKESQPTTSTENRTGIWAKPTAPRSIIQLRFSLNMVLFCGEAHLGLPVFWAGNKKI